MMDEAFVIIVAGQTIVVYGYPKMVVMVCHHGVHPPVGHLDKGEGVYDLVEGLQYGVVAGEAMAGDPEVTGMVFRHDVGLFDPGVGLSIVGEGGEPAAAGITFIN